MGDTCNLIINLRKNDLEGFNKILEKQMWKGKWYDEDLSKDPEIITAMVGEANYAWMSERKDLAKANFTFHGSHGMGDDYNSKVFVCFEGEYFEITTTTNGRLLCYVTNDGILKEGEAETVQGYFRVLSQIYKLWGESRCPICHTAYLVDEGGIVYCQVCG